MSKSKNWLVKDRLFELHSTWVTVIAEHLQDDKKQILEYWRVEKANSVLILTIQNNHLILPPPSYRPGIGELTLDFPGGRVGDGESPEVAVSSILLRELGISENYMLKISTLNSQGWLVNSSFSNQKLYGYVVEIDPNLEIESEYIGAVYPINNNGIQKLLNNLSCLQCRGVLMQWWLNQIM